MILVYDPTTRLIKLTYDQDSSDIKELLTSMNESFVVTKEQTNIADDYIDDDLSVKPLQHLEPTYNKTSILDDGVDTFEMTSIADDAILTVDGIEQPVSNNAFAFHTTDQGEYTIVLQKTKFKQFVLKVTAHG